MNRFTKFLDRLESYDAMCYMPVMQFFMGLFRHAIIGLCFSVLWFWSAGAEAAISQCGPTTRELLQNSAPTTARDLISLMKAQDQSVEDISYVVPLHFFDGVRNQTDEEFSKIVEWVRESWTSTLPTKPTFPQTDRPRDFYASALHSTDTWLKVQQEEAQDEMALLIKRWAGMTAPRSERPQILAAVQQLQEGLNQYNYEVLASLAGILNHDGVQFEIAQVSKIIGKKLSVSVPVLRIAPAGEHPFNKIALALSKNKDGPIKIMVGPDDQMRISVDPFNALSREIRIGYDVITSGRYHAHPNFQNPYYKLLIGELAKSDPEFGFWNITARISHGGTSLPKPSRSTFSKAQAFDESMAFALNTISYLARIRKIAKSVDAVSEKALANNRLFAEFANTVELGAEVSRRSVLIARQAEDALRIAAPKGYVEADKGLVTARVLLNDGPKDGNNYKYSVDVSLPQFSNPNAAGESETILWTDSRAEMYRQAFATYLGKAESINLTYASFFDELREFAEEYNTFEKLSRREGLPKLEAFMKRALKLQLPISASDLLGLPVL